MTMPELTPIMPGCEVGCTGGVGGHVGGCLNSGVTRRTEYISLDEARARTAEAMQTFGKLLPIARNLCRPDDQGGEPPASASEYIRGQAELICEAMGLGTDDHRDWLIKAILAP